MSFDRPHAIRCQVRDAWPERVLRLCRLSVVGLAALGPFATSAHAADAPPLKIGVLTDMGGSLADATGAGSVAAAELAVADFGGSVLGRKIVIVAADHQYKPDVAATILRQWFDTEQVEAVADGAISVFGLAAQTIAREKHKISLISGAGSTDLFGKACSPTGFVWTFDTDVLAKAVVRGVMSEKTKSWFFIVPDFSFGKQLAQTASDTVVSLGGSVVGVDKVPIGATDNSSALTHAAASGARVVALGHGGHDLVTAIKQVAEFGIREQGQQVVAMFTEITDVHAIGLPQMRDTLVATPFYWDLDDDTRRFGHAFYDKMKRYPTMFQAGVYSQITHYLKAVAATGSIDALKVAETMRQMPINDLTLKGARIRSDGRVLRDMYLMKVKDPAESKAAWDYYKLVRTIPASELFSDSPSPDCRDPAK